MRKKKVKKPGTVYVQARDPVTKKSAGKTLYETTPQEVIAVLERAAK